MSASRRPGPSWWYEPEDGKPVVFIRPSDKQQWDEIVAAAPNLLGDAGAYLTQARVYSSRIGDDDGPKLRNEIAQTIWESLDKVRDMNQRQRLLLVQYARQHMTDRAKARIFRLLARDPYSRVRLAVTDGAAKLTEVTVPLNDKKTWTFPEGFPKKGEFDVCRHPYSPRRIADLNLPQFAVLKQMREFLDIRSRKQLGYFLLATDGDNGPYACHTVPKNSGGERRICAPRPALKWVQRRILHGILGKIPVHPAAHGFVPGRSIATNAAPHVGAKIVIKFDLKDFFPTIHYFRVVGLFGSLGYPVVHAEFDTADYSTHVAGTLARLCCYAGHAQPWSYAVLPQGAPTSPVISNLVCRSLDTRLTGLAAKAGGVYTRYADDLTFSFKETYKLDVAKLRWWVDQICHREGFLVNQKKFRVFGRGQRQEVTGVVVNDRLNVVRETRRELRAIVHNCEITSVAAQAARNADCRGDEKKFLRYLRGMAAYYNVIDPVKGRELVNRVAALGK